MLCKIAASQLKLVQHLDLSDGSQVSFSDIEAATEWWSQTADHWYGRCAGANAKAVFFGRAVSWLGYMGSYEVVGRHPHEHAVQAAEYSAWMEQERGFSQSTITGCLSTVNQFLAWSDRRGVSLADLRVENVDEYVSHCHGRGCRRSTIRAYADRLRRFFRNMLNSTYCRKADQ